MDEKKKSLNIKILIPIIAIVIVGIIAAVLFLNKEEGYRSIKVHEVSGSVTLEQENVGTMEAYENLNLISGDKLQTLVESYVRLKMDEDKYVLVEQESKLQIYATGNTENSTTDIRLDSGAITVEVENKLNDDSSFEVTTPNAVMAIRGTVFRVTTDVDENGNPITRVTIFDGKVAVQKIEEDGTLSEEVIVESGKEALIYEENNEEIIVILDEIDVSQLPLEVLEFLKEIAEDGEELSISLDEIEELIEAIENPVYTVTFMYNGQVFGTQKVNEGELVTKPTLKPAPTGNWNYDFGEPITEDTTIEFIE